MADAEVGQQLRRFFIELLEDQNLQRYRSEERGDYIGERRHDNDGYLGPEAEALLRCHCLKEIEDHISAISGSGNAAPVWVVCPPL